MTSKVARLEAKRVEVELGLGNDPPPIMGVQVKRRVRIRAGRLLEVRQRATIVKPPLGGGADQK